MSENTTPNQPQVVGQLTEEEITAIADLRATASKLLAEVGQIELRKNRILMTLERNEQQAQAILVGARDRLEIPEGTPWQVQEDGNVLALTPSAEGEETTSEG
jgi:hypothetical protein